MVGHAPHDRELLDALERFTPEPYRGAIWRATWATRDPIRGSTAGGRWSPTDSFETLNTSLEADGAIAETYFHLSRAPVFSSAHLKLHKLEARTIATLNLRNLEILSQFDVDQATLKSMAYDRTQAIGAAAHFLEFDSVLVPSARWECENLIIFLDRVDVGEALTIKETMDINWPAWKERLG